MQQAEVIFFWATVFTYGIAFCLHLFGFITEKDRGIKYASRLLCLGFAFHTAAVIARWLAAGHAPVTDTYELNLTGMWFAMLVYMVFERVHKVNRSIALVVVPITFLVLGNSLISRSDVTPMGPAYHSPWLIIHVIFAWLAFGCYAISTGAAIFLLLKARFPSYRSFAKLPLLEALDLASYRFIVLGFINHAIMLASGAIWAKKLWGHYWSWDALETWSLIAFLFYALYLHVRAFWGWKTKSAAWMTLLGIIILAISFWAVGWFSPSVHPGP